MTCCEHHNINCNQGRGCPLRAEETDPPRDDRKPSDLMMVLAMEFWPFVPIVLVALVWVML